MVALAQNLAVWAGGPRLATDVGYVDPAPLSLAEVVEWFDPTQGIAFGTGSAVASWTGRKAATVAAQSTAGNRPTWAVDAGRGVPGLTLVGGSVHHLTFGASLAGLFSGVASYTVFANVRIVALNGPGFFCTMLSVSDAAGGSDMRMSMHVNGNAGEEVSYRLVDGTVNTATAAAAAVASGEPFTFTQRWGGSGVPSIWKNGVAQSVSGAHSVNLGTQTIGAIGATMIQGVYSATNYPTAIFGDVIVANAAMSDSNVAAVQEFLASRRP